jgi:trigger factor
MSREVKKVGASQYEVKVSATKENWQESQKKAFENLAKEVTVKGFRKGQAPLNHPEVKKQISQAQIYDNAINLILNDLYREVLDEEKLVPFAQPGVEVTKLSDVELEVMFKITVAPEVKLGKYKGFKVAKETINVSEDEVNEEIRKLQEQSAELVVVEREAKKGDTVVIDFEGFVDGKAFEGGKGENYSLELGSNTFIPGFEDQLVGVKAEEEKDVNVTFPENYVENLKGKAATFKVKVHEVKEKHLPNLDDEFAKESGHGVNTFEELKLHVRGHLEADANTRSENKQFNEIIAEIAKEATVEIPQSVIDGEVKAMKQNLVQQISQQGLTLDKYLEIIGKKEADLDKEMAEEAAINVKNYLVLEEVAKQEKIEVTDADVDFEIAKIAAQYNMEEAKVREILKDSLDRLSQEVRMRKIHDFLVDNNQ